MNDLEGLIRHMAYTWKEGGGDAASFRLAWPGILHEIRNLEQTPLENYIGSLGASDQL